MRAPSIDEVVSAAERYAMGSVDYGEKWACGVIEAMSKCAPQRETSTARKTENEAGGGMKGRDIFTQAEAERIRALLRQVREAVSAAEQKKLRDRLRINIGFYISDFARSNAGFTAADFDGLVDHGTIKVI